MAEGWKERHELFLNPFLEDLPIVKVNLVLQGG